MKFLLLVFFFFFIIWAFELITLLIFFFGDEKTLIWKYCKNVWTSNDLQFNAALGGDPRMTFSARMGKAIASGRCKLCRPVCKFLTKYIFRSKAEHCAETAASPKDQGYGDEIVKL